jgi:hypothetical protein
VLGRWYDRTYVLIGGGEGAEAVSAVESVAVVEELADRCGKAAVEDVSLLSNDELRALVLAVEGARASLDAVEGHALAELEARDGCDRDLGLSTVSWLCDRGRVPRRCAAARVRLANTLRRELDGVDVALGQGRIGFEHARVLADATNPRIAEVIAGVQDQLVAAAQHAPFAVWRREVAGLVELVDQDGGHDPDEDLARNRLHASRVGGELSIRGALVGEHALVFEHALEQATDRLWRRHRDDQDRCGDLPIPSRATLRALAMVELTRHGLAVTSSSSAPVVDVTLVVRAHSPDDTDPAVTAETAHGDHEPTVRLTTPDGERLRPAGLWHLLCDPVIHRLRLDDAAVPLDLGRQVRLATPAQRRALAVRDRGCVFPGCGARASWCDAHHLVEWDNGGTTDLSNLALLCRHHHGVTHRHGWTMTANPDGGFTWTTPTGRTLHSHPPNAPP